jgi:hypothetical protein
VGEGNTRDVDELARDNESLRDQQRAVSDVLRAVVRSEGLQPVLDEIVGAAMWLCHGEHAQFYLAEGDLFHIASYSADIHEAAVPATRTGVPRRSSSAVAARFRRVASARSGRPGRRRSGSRRRDGPVDGRCQGARHSPGGGDDVDLGRRKNASWRPA